MDKQILSFVSNFSKELREGNVAVFAGAGLSVPGGYVNWAQLLAGVANDLSLDIKKEHDLVALAQYYCNEHGGNRGKLNQMLVTEFGKAGAITENHKILARLPITTFWTTNYDKLIEDALGQAGKVADVKHETAQLAVTRPNRDAVVYKMHGDADQPDNAVLVKDDYERYHIDGAPFITALSGDLVSKTFLFLGFSFTDPNLDYVLSRIRVTFSKHQRQHYCLMRRHIGTKPQDEYMRRKQLLFINDLKRFNIQTLLVDDYSDITEALRRIEAIHRQQTIFMSGSAHEYGTWPDNEAEDFIHSLASGLIKKSYNVVSGFGLGVGSFVINGALSEMGSMRHKTSRDQLVLRPFPQKKTGTKDLRVLWDDYRQEMISGAGIAIFVFGNKKKAGKILLAEGVEKEFEIAKKKGLKLLPIGATGYVAQKLWRKVDKDFKAFFPKTSRALRHNFKIIGDAKEKPSAILIATMSIIAELNVAGN